MYLAPLQSRDLAYEDAIVALDKLLQTGQVPLDGYLKQVCVAGKPERVQGASREHSRAPLLQTGQVPLEGYLKQVCSAAAAGTQLHITRQLKKAGKGPGGTEGDTVVRHCLREAGRLGRKGADATDARAHAGEGRPEWKAALSLGWRGRVKRARL